MANRFDPNFPTHLEGDFLGVVAVTEHPAIGDSNLVVDPSKPFEVSVSWHIFGDLTPLWLTALQTASPDWVVTAYAESIGPGDEKILVADSVPVGAGPFSLDQAYSHTMSVPPFALSEENPGDPTQSGVYKLVVTVFLDSQLGPIGYDIMGYAEGPIIKVENPI